MLLGCGCLLAAVIAFAPRLALILMWLVGERVNMAFDSWIWPLLGLIFLPYTTIFYVLTWSMVGGVHGWDWVWVGLGLLLDLVKWGQVANTRREVPGYPATAP